MTKEELHEQLVKEVDQYCPHCTPKSKKLVVELMEDVLAAPEDQRQKIVDFLRLSKKAEAYGLNVDVDKSTKLFFIKDIATNTVVAPPPMNTASVTAWLEDYMKEVDKENSAT